MWLCFLHSILTNADRLYTVCLVFRSPHTHKHSLPIETTIKLERSNVSVVYLKINNEKEVVIFWGLLTAKKVFYSWKILDRTWFLLVCLILQWPCVTLKMRQSWSRVSCSGRVTWVPPSWSLRANHPKAWEWCKLRRLWEGSRWVCFLWIESAENNRPDDIAGEVNNNKVLLGGIR